MIRPLSEDVRGVLVLRFHPLEERTFINQDAPPHATDALVESVPVGVKHEVPQSAQGRPRVKVAPIGQGDESCPVFALRLHFETPYFRGGSL